VTGRICLWVMLLACAALPARAAQHTEAIAALSQRYVEQPQSHYLAYLLARFCAEDGLDDEAIAWLARLHKRGWDLGINPRDFPRLQGSEEFRAIRAKLQRQQQRRERGQRALLVDTPGLVPEGLAYDGKRERFLIGALNAPRIHAVDLRGKVSLLWSVQEPVVVLGMAVTADGETLYAVIDPSDARRKSGDKPFVVRIALADGRELGRLPAPAAGFLNDLCLMRDGRVYASDSEQSRLFHAAPDAQELSLWEAPGHAIAANGMACDDARNVVYVAVYNGISRVEADSGQARLLDTPRSAAAGGNDGLYLHHDDLIGVQNGFGAGRVLRARLSADGRSITRVETFESAIVDLNEPTTGALTPEGFVYIANSQIWKWDAEAEKLRSGVQLAPIMLRRIPL
jgi:sugar lactone lactonase YvrE